MQDPAVEAAIVETVREFVDNDVRSSVREFEVDDIYPEPLVETMKSLGVFGLLIPTEYGGTDVSARCFAIVSEELARGWMSLAGAMGGHSVISYLIASYGTPQQKQKYLPGMATGQIRAAMALSEPSGGSDLQGIHTTARREGDDYIVGGTKMWITNAAHSQVFGLLCKTSFTDPAHRGMSLLLLEAGDDVAVSSGIKKLGYRGIETCEVLIDDARVGQDAVLGGDPGEGWNQIMQGLVIGRIQVAARAVGVAQAALDRAVEYAGVRETFGKPIWRHQSVGNLIADIATRTEAARRLTRHAAELVDAGESAHLQAGMAKLFASEVGAQVSLDAMRVHGGYGYSTEFEVERLYRDAPLMIIGEGTNEIQRNLIAKSVMGSPPRKRKR